MIIARGGMHGGMHGEMQGKYYRYCSRSIRYSTDLNSENNKFDLETFDLVSEYCRILLFICEVEIDVRMKLPSPSFYCCTAMYCYSVDEDIGTIQYVCM